MEAIIDGGEVVASSSHLTSAEVGFAAAVLVALISLVSLWVTNTSTKRRDRQKVLVERWDRQLNELYAPIVVLLDQDAVFRDRLKQGKGEKWHILDHVDEVRADAVDGQLAQRIVQANDQIRAIIDSKAGLAGEKVPPSFARFMMHQNMLSRALAGLPVVREPQELQYFPQDFEDDIRAGYEDLQRKLKKELGQT